MNKEIKATEVEILEKVLKEESCYLSIRQEKAVLRAMGFMRESILSTLSNTKEPDKISSHFDIEKAHEFLTEKDNEISQLKKELKNAIDCVEHMHDVEKEHQKEIEELREINQSNVSHIEAANELFVEKDKLLSEAIVTLSYISIHSNSNNGIKMADKADNFLSSITKDNDNG